MAKLITGILAHVDAGKTTLSEALLYETGAIRNLGRVDSKNAFLDNNSIERERGITIFSKQAELNQKITLIDTPGHVDFSAEMERTLAVLDAAILLINASDGIQSHTKTLWSLLKQYKIPTVIFVNKMDMPDTNQDVILKKLQQNFSENVICFDKKSTKLDSFYEKIGNSDDFLAEKYLSGEEITTSDISKAISERKLFPCIFGSALKLEGVKDLLEVMDTYLKVPEYPSDFGCIIYKISKDKQNNRLTHLKVTGGVLKVKDQFGEEKANEVRIYSGEKYEMVKEVSAGNVCTVTGLKDSYAGQAYGISSNINNYRMEPALIYSVIPPAEVDIPKMLHILREMEEELPEIKVEYSEQNSEICVKLMGEVQTEVIKQLLLDRYKINIEFGEGRIAYKETITEPVIGVGHYEPLRHYAEVHIKMSPLPRGSGLKFLSRLSVDVLDTNWQRLIMTHLKEKQHVGVLTGSPITDMELEIVAGRAHLKHTEGGDFRQSTYRAIRHGLMYSKSILLEPMYSYEIVVPEANTGRVMSDMEKMHGTFVLDESLGGFTTLHGRVPVSTMKNYMNEVRSYTKGLGTLSLAMDGYEVCHNQEEVLKQLNYNPDADLANPAGSVFCSHGAGFTVNWDEVLNYKHLESPKL
ncbi:MAG: TetM/TetW/TetO/TetS family tetracycline resistance ribosomal protection protein [Treponema sp.]|nr:TetM/TetW/TetO/TetS family tetracycline resistance ribosomal protection protein [Treponema sp.]